MNLINKTIIINNIILLSFLLLDLLANYLLKTK